MSQVYNSDEYEYSFDGSINNDIEQNNIQNANNNVIIYKKFSSNQHKYTYLIYLQMEFQFNPTGQNEKVFTY